MRALDSLTTQAFAGTEEAIYPFWSPDSRFIGFFSGGKLKKIEASGGSVQTLCDAPQGFGGAWNADGVIVFTRREAEALYRVSAAGGQPVPVTTLDASRNEVSHLHPHFLPDGRHLIYLATSPQRESAGIYAASLDSKETKLLVNTDVSAAYAPGYLLFLRDRTLMSQGFDADRGELRGDPTPIAEEVDRLGQGARFALFSVSQTGVLVYRSGSSETTQLIWFDREGKQLGTAGPPANYAVPWLSPDEKRVVFGRLEQQSGNADIWIMELARGTLTRFTFDPALDLSPIWSPDGSRIIFASDRDGTPNLYLKAASGAGNDEPLLKSDHRKIPFDWSADGKFILYQERIRRPALICGSYRSQERKGRFRSCRRSSTSARVGSHRTGSGSPTPPMSRERGRFMCRAFPLQAASGRCRPTAEAQPQWRRDGKEIFYLSPDRKLMTVDVQGNGPTFEAGVPKAMFELRIQSVGLPGPRNFYVAAGDGQRFLVTSLLLGEPTATPTTVVLNWTADLKR